MDEHYLHGKIQYLAILWIDILLYKEAINVHTVLFGKT